MSQPFFVHAACARLLCASHSLLFLSLQRDTFPFYSVPSYRPSHLVSSSNPELIALASYSSS